MTLLHTASCAGQLSLAAWLMVAALMTRGALRFLRGRAQEGDVMRAMLWFIALRIAYTSVTAQIWPTLGHLPPLALTVRLTGQLFSVVVAALSVYMVETKARVQS